MVDWEKYYTRGTWKGIDNYQCELCPFATVEGIGAILAHLQVHFLARPTSEIVIADGGGRVLGTADVVFADEEE